MFQFTYASGIVASLLLPYHATVSRKTKNVALPILRDSCRLTAADLGVICAISGIYLCPVHKGTTGE